MSRASAKPNKPKTLGNPLPTEKKRISVLEDVIGLNRSVGIEEGNPRDLQIKKLRDSIDNISTYLKENLKATIQGLPYDAIKKAIKFKITLEKTFSEARGTGSSTFEGGLDVLRDFEKFPKGREIFQKSAAISGGSNPGASPTSFELCDNYDTCLKSLTDIFEDDSKTDEQKMKEFLKLKNYGEDSPVGIIVNRYRSLKVTDSYKLTYIALELELIKRQIERYTKDLEETYLNSFNNSSNVSQTIRVESLTANLKGYDCSSEIENIIEVFNEKHASFLTKRNEIEDIQIQNYDKLTSAQKHPSIQAFKSEILSRKQFDEVFAGITLSSIQFAALREIEAILLNPNSRSKPLISFNMGEGKSFLIELAKKYETVIKRDEAQYGADFEDKVERLEVLKSELERHREAIYNEKGNKVFSKEGNSIPLVTAKAIVKELEAQIEALELYVNQSKLRGLHIEIIDRANEERKLLEFNAAQDLSNTLIFWDESRYGLQETGSESGVKLGEQLRNLKNKGANLVLVGATVNEIKLVEAVNRAKHKGKTRQQIAKVEYDLEEFRKRKFRAIENIGKSTLSREEKEFDTKWAEIVKENHGSSQNKRSQHVFLDLKLESKSESELSDGLKKIVEGDGPQLAMVNFIHEGEYRCLIAKKGNPPAIVNTKVGNRDYYAAILQGGVSSRFSNIKVDRELTADEINAVKSLPFVENIAEIYGERYSIGGVYDKVDVLRTETDAQILYVDKKVNLAEIGQAQSRNRNSKALNNRRIVIQDGNFDKDLDVQGFANMALRNFEQRDLNEFIEDLDSKMAKYFRSRKKFSEVLLATKMEDQEWTKIVGGDEEFIMTKFKSETPNLDGVKKRKFIRDVKIFLLYEALQKGQQQRYTSIANRDYKNEFITEPNEETLGESSEILSRGKTFNFSEDLNTNLHSNEDFINHFARLSYAKKTQACIDREQAEIKQREAEERKNRKAREAETARKMQIAAAELEKLRKEEEDKQKYLESIAREAKSAREEIERLQRKEEDLKNQLAKQTSQAGKEIVDNEQITQIMLEEIEATNSRIKLLIEDEQRLSSQRDTAVGERDSTSQRLKNLTVQIQTLSNKSEALRKMGEELKSLYQQSQDRANRIAYTRLSLEQKQKEYDALRNENAASSNDLEGVDQAVKKMDENIRRIFAAVQRSNNQLQELYAEQKEINNKIAALTEKIKSQESQKEELGKALLQKNTKLDELTPKKEELEKKLKVFQAQIQAITKDRNSKNSQIVKLDEDSKNLRIAIKEAQGEIAKIDNIIIQIGNSLDHGGKLKATQESEVLKLDRENAALQLKIKDFTQELAILEADSKNKVLLLNELKGKLSNASEAWRKLEKQNQDLKSRIELLQQQRASKVLQEGEIVLDLNQKKQKNGGLDEEILALEAQLAQQTTAVEAARKKESELRASVTNTGSDISGLDDRISSLQQERNSLEEQITKKSSLALEKESLVSRLEREVQDIEQRVLAISDIEERAVQVAALIEEIAVKQNALKESTLKEEVVKLYSETLQKLQESLQTSFVRISAEQESARNQQAEERQKLEDDLIQELEADIKQILEKQAQDLKREMEENVLAVRKEKENQSEEYETLIKSLMDELKVSQEDSSREAIQSQISELESKNNNLVKQLEQEKFRIALLESQIAVAQEKDEQGKHLPKMPELNEQNQIGQDEKLLREIHELTILREADAARLAEIQAQRKIAAVHMKLPEDALAEPLRMFQLSPEELTAERSKKRISNRDFKLSIGGSKLAGNEVEIVAPITPNNLSIRNFYPNGEGLDQRYYDAEFRKLTFTDFPKTENGSGIFNDALLLRANFRGCEFYSVDFSKIDPQIFSTIKFSKCEFQGETKLPEGFELDKNKVVKSGEVRIVEPEEQKETVDIPRVTPRTTMTPRQPVELKSSISMTSPRLLSARSANGRSLASRGFSMLTDGGGGTSRK